MKKSYSKPAILFDDFSLSTNIAAGCENIVKTFAQYQCGIKFGNVTFFHDSAYCARLLPNGSEFNGFCYHNPTDSNNHFSS